MDQSSKPPAIAAANSNKQAVKFTINANNTPQQPSSPIASISRGMNGFDLTSARAKGEVTSSPVAKRQRTAQGLTNSNAASSEESDDDDPFAGLGTSSSRHLTQPTQIINEGTPRLPSSPRHHSPVHDTPRSEQVQVPASSPYQNMSSSSLFGGSKRPAEGSARAGMIAPAGTSFRPPVKAAPVIVDLDDDDGPKYQGGDSDSDIEEISSADIQPSMFKTGKISMGGATATPSFKSLMTTFTRPITNRVASVYQGGPARAMPVGSGMTLRDIKDDIERRKVERIMKTLPKFTVKEVSDALRACKDYVDEAIRYLIRMGEEREAAANKALGFTKGVATPKSAFHKPPAPPPSTMKRTLGTPVGSITQRYGQVAASMTPHEPQSSVTPEKPKRKLMQGRRNPVDSPEKASTPARKSKQHEDIEEIGGRTFSDAEDYNTDDGSEIVENVEASEKLLKYLNKCEANDLAELVNIQVKDAEFFISKRPFKYLDQAREVSNAKDTKSGRKSARTPIGDKIVDNAMDMMTGYEAVDELVIECAKRGEVIKKEMSTWGFDIFGGPAGEMEMTSLGEQFIDSGLGTPSSKMSEAGDDDVKVVVTKRKPKFLGKPKVMADSLQMKDYQIVGLNWLHMMYKQKNSCILADDMGLGKTCQVISFIAQLVMEGRTGPHLVVVPPSTLDNWLAEISKFCPTLIAKTIIYRGTQPERAEIADRVITDPVGSWNIVITTFEMAHKPMDNKFLRKLRPDVCVYDEAHVLKNPKSLKYQGLIKIGGKFRLFLTGTPLQNNLMELTALLAFIMPDLFAEKQEALDYIFKHKASTKDANHAALLSAERVNRAKSMLTPFVLRRKKAQVMKDLPAKTCRVEYCDLRSEQAELYRSIKDRALDRACIIAEGGKVADKVNDNNNPIMQLRKAALHPLLFRRHFTDEMIEEMAELLRKHHSNEFPPDQERKFLVQEMQNMNDFALHQWCQNDGKESAIRHFDIKEGKVMESGKIDALVELLKKYKANGDRVLIFSQFVIMLNILEEVLGDDSVKVPFMRIDGSTKVDERQPIIDKFQHDEDCTAMLLSTGAGGTGINLMMANKVIIFDASFNPQEDIQAENRAHRVGQTREVEVVRLVSKNTIEEQIYRLGQSKLELDNKVVGAEEMNEKIGQSMVAKMLFEDEAKKDGKGEKTELSGTKAENVTKKVPVRARRGAKAT